MFRRIKIMYLNWHIKYRHEMFSEPKVVLRQNFEYNTRWHNNEHWLSPENWKHQHRVIFRDHVHK